MPLNADFENAFADDPDGVAENVTRCIATGVTGLSVEDSPNNAQTPLYDFELSVARVKAARAAIDRAGGDVVFTARAENFIRGVPDLDDAIRRLKAYKDAGADCLYAPGIRTREQIEAVVKAVAPKPVNFLAGWAMDFTVSDIAAMGVRRISVGGSLARAAMHAFIKTATEIAKDGKFDGFAGTHFQSRAEQILQRGSQEAFVMDVLRTVGAPVDTTPARLPEPITLSGRFGSVSKLDAGRDAADLWRAFAGHDEIWTYISRYGPFADEPTFSAWLAERANV